MTKQLQNAIAKRTCQLEKTAQQAANSDLRMALIDAHNFYGTRRDGVSCGLCIKGFIGIIDLRAERGCNGQYF
jgi:hypothetical protein